MPSTMKPTIEHRRYRRAALLATADLHLPEDGAPLGRFSVINASAGGLLLAGKAPGETGRLQVVVHLPDGRSVQTPAEVVRRRPGRGRATFALSFAEPAPEAQLAIDDAVWAAVAASSSAEVLIADGNLEATHALREDSYRLGYRAFAVSTPLEVIDALARPNQVKVAVVDAVLTGHGSGWGEGPEVLSYLAESHPSVRRVLMVSPNQLWQLELARDPSVAGAHAVLTKPWDDPALDLALGRAG
jgi:CheY-like chemotaxis protein